MNMSTHGHGRSTAHRRVAATCAASGATTRLRTGLVAASVAAALLSGCTSLVGHATSPLLAKREAPGVILCMSERTPGGGIRIVGTLNMGIYPITRATIEYRAVGVSDPMPATPGENGKTLVLSKPRTSKGSYRKGDGKVEFTIDAEAARELRGKVIWYRWIIAYNRGGSDKVDITDIHRTSLEEAGLPRSPGSPGPDSSVALPTVPAGRRH